MTGFWGEFVLFSLVNKKTKVCERLFMKFWWIIPMCNCKDGWRMSNKLMVKRMFQMLILCQRFLKFNSQALLQKTTWLLYMASLIWVRWTTKQCWKWPSKWAKCKWDRMSKIISVWTMQTMSLKSKNKISTIMPC